MSNKPLHNRRIVITRQNTGSFARDLITLGADPLHYPAIQIQAPDDWQVFDQALKAIASYDWLIVTSQNTVHALATRMQHFQIAPQQFAHLKIAAVGERTAQALRELNLHVDYIPERSTATDLLASLPPITGARIWLPQSQIAPIDLAQGLKVAKAHVDSTSAYTTVPHPAINNIYQHLQEGGIDALTFFSSSAVQNTLETLKDHDPALKLLHNLAIISIGPSTTATLHTFTTAKIIEAPEPTQAGVIQALLNYFKNSMQPF